MGRQIVFTAPGQVALEDTPDPPLQPDEVRLRTLFSGISAGTELTQYRGSNPYLHKRFDAARRLFLEDRPGPAYPLRGVGYEQVGEVVEVGSEVRGVRIGQRVWGSWGHRSHVVLAGSQTASRVMPEGVDPRLGVFARIGAVALNAVHDADIHLGEVVALFGMGVLGLIALQLARLSGATVIAVDGLEKRLNLARQLGAEHLIDFRQTHPGKAIKDLTQGRGADVSLELSGSYAALHEAIRATAYNSRVVAAGFLQGEGMGLRLGEEFHHNRIELVSSQTQGISPRLAHRWDRLRQEQTIMQLAAQGRLQLLPLITHTFPFEQIAAAYQLLDQQPGEAVQVVLEFP
ncbi:zinc-binding dehydrogenase [Meiothermus rufus]|uniref:zinc-binding dehydrogenase n=1 Tax=Meiothermus rufus TaxID=604332 RepID=UPI0004843941|nr:zinc-binding dehydrogenase [Meiothermus rufus]